MNLDFGAQPMFSWYVVLLVLSGAAMIGLAATKSGTTNMRGLNALIGAALLGYGIYLGFIFQGGTYYVLFQVFVVPVLLILNSTKSLLARRKIAVAQQAQRVQRAKEVLQARQAAQAGRAAPSAQPVTQPEAPVFADAAPAVANAAPAVTDAAPAVTGSSAQS